MGTTVAKVIEWMDMLAPPDLACKWDNVGLHTGARDSWVERVLVALSLEPRVLSEAVDQGAELIVLHHPAIFRPLHHLRSDDPISHLLVRAVRSNIALFSAHTNLDAAPEGLNTSLAERLGLEASEVLIPSAGSGALGGVPTGHAAAGLGRIGQLSRPLTVEELGRWVKARLGLPALRIASGSREELWETTTGAQVASPAQPPGSTDAVDRDETGGPGVEHEQEPGMPETPEVRASHRLIERVAVIGGAGAGHWREALDRGADALVTGDVDYHEALDAVHSGLIVIDAGHFGTERHIAEEVARYLRDRADKVGVLLDVFPSEQGRDPFRML